MPTTSISLRPDSAIARSTLRPMRPNPLIATRTAIQFSSNVLKFRILRLLDRFLTDSWAGFRAVHAPNEQSLQCIIAPNVPIALLHIQALCGGLDHRLGRDPKMLVERFRRGAGAEALHTDEDSIRSDHRIPAEPHRGLDRDLDRSCPYDRAAPFFRLRQQQFERGYRHHPRRDAASGKLLLRGDGDLNLRARRIQRYLGVALRGHQFIGAMTAQIVGVRDGARWREVLPGQSE